MFKKLLTWLTGLFLCLTAVKSQFIPFDNYSVKDGLPSNTVYDVEQDLQGYLWFATQAGAVRFDGYHFVNYTIENGLPDNNVSDIFADSQGRIWLATENGGLAVIEKNHLNVYNTRNGLVSDRSLFVFGDPKGNIWFVSVDEGISVIKPSGIENYNSTNSSLNGRIFATYVGLSGTVWLSTSDNIFYYDKKLHQYHNKSLKGCTVSNILECNDSSFWFATQNNGILHILDGKETWYNKNNLLKSNNSLAIAPFGRDTIIITTYFPGGLYMIHKNKIVQKWESELTNMLIHEVYADRKKRIWMNTEDKGLVLLDNGELTFINQDNNLINNRVEKIFEDSNGNIWMGTLNGLSKYGKIIFQIYGSSFINDDNSIMSISSYKDNVYLGTNAGLNILSGNVIVEKFEPRNSSIFAILHIDENEAWLGTYEGLIHKKGRNYTHIPGSIFMANQDDPEIITDVKTDGKKIYCASSGGLASYADGKYESLGTEQNLSVWGLEIDRENNIWCATVNGLGIYDGTTFRLYDTADGLPHYYCSDITFDREGYGWLATDRGISRILLNADRTLTCTNISIKDGLRSNIIFSILADKKGYIWAGHNLGVDRIDPSNMKITNYGAEEGFLPVETSLGAAVTTQDDEIWFGTVDGAVKYVPKNDVIQADPPKIYITNISFYNDSTPASNYAEGIDPIKSLPVNLTLPYNKNNLIFSYIGLHYTIVVKNRYMYYLKGYDSDWSEPTPEIETPRYPKVPPGRYTFMVKAANCDGVWSDPPAEFTFYIRPPFWQTWWCYTLEAIAVFFIFLLVMRLRERKLRHDKEVLTQKVKERTIEIEKNRDQIALQKKEITDSIEYAQKIQSAVLPKKEVIDEFLNEYFILYMPRDIVSGDFYWINKIGDKLVIVAADCTGHGVPGAFMSMLGISILNEISSQKQAMSSGKILDTLRDHLTRTLKQTGQDEEAKDGMDMALCIIDRNKMQMQYSGAYNPLLFVRNNELIVYKADKMPVGYHMGEMPPFTSHVIPFKQGDCFYIFSDGYADQFGGPDGKKFMSGKLRELLLEISPLPMSEQKAALNETIKSWMGINEQVDDILLMGIRL